MNWLTKIFHSHTLIPFKWYDGRLAAAYCKKCGCIKTGNPVYHDGTTYQETLHGQEAVKFLSDLGSSLCQRIDSVYEDVRKNPQLYSESYLTANRQYLDMFETPEAYDEILKAIIRIQP